MATSEKLALGTQSTLITLAATLASNAYLAAGAAYNNVQAGGGGDGYPRARLTLNATFGAAPTVPSAVYIWFLTSEDGGTSYELGGTGATLAPARLPDLVIPLIATTSAQQLSGDCALPDGLFVPYIQNAGSGQNLPIGATLKILPYTRQGV
jgi:hypothetical protein